MKLDHGKTEAGGLAEVGMAADEEVPVAADATKNPR
jgi:hypothetical protein